ncbi:MAG TPA: DUF504 domain-containing protein [Methanoregulaceae archaeon]|nr:DUF504 domain-containing protein [Methanoregulaceae archaeon]
MRKSRELLLRFFHDPKFRFDDVEVCYVNRGVPGDISCISGDRITSLDSFYMEIESEWGKTPIPYHRLRKILYKGIPVWEK